MKDVCEYNPIHLVGFTTNPDIIPCSFLLTMYFSSSLCNSIIAHSTSTIEYDRVINEIRIHVTFTAINPLNQTNSNDCTKKNGNDNEPEYEKADSYMIFVMMENEKAIGNFQKILNFSKKFCNPEKKIYVIGVYYNLEKIKTELSETNLNEFLDNERIYYDLLLVDLNDINTFDKIIDFVTMEGLNNSRKSLDKSNDNSQISNDGYKDCDTSNSGCLII